MEARQAAELVRAHLAGQVVNERGLHQAISVLCSLADTPAPPVTPAQVAKALLFIGKLWRDWGPESPLHDITVLALRFGLFGGRQTTFAEIERTFNIPIAEARKRENELLAQIAEAASA